MIPPPLSGSSSGGTLCHDGGVDVTPGPKLSAQTAGTISGHVSNATGAAIPDVTITLTNVGTGTMRTMVTTQDCYPRASAFEIGRNQHCGTENSPHWRLDVVVNEDRDRTRMGHGPRNLAVLRHGAINAMQKEGSKGSLRGKFKPA